MKIAVTYDNGEIFSTSGKQSLLKFMKWKTTK